MDGEEKLKKFSHSVEICADKGEVSKEAVQRRVLLNRNIWNGIFCRAALPRDFVFLY